MNIDWLSLTVGIAIGIFITNAISFISAAINYKRAQNKLAEVTGKIKQAQDELAKRKQVIINVLSKIKEK